jgi:cyclic pyranopterin phosphate synthase
VSAPLDVLQRPLRDLRISVTDRCNFRCVYCMPKEIFGRDYEFLPRAQLLDYEEIERLARAFVANGVRKIRITGGEPLVRRHVERLVEMLSALDVDLTLTTNGTLLPQKAQALAAAGLRRVTVSLDALDDETFRAMNDMDVPVQQVLDGIDAAASAEEILTRIADEFPLEPIEPSYRGEVAKRWRYVDGQGEIGVIASVTQPFCGDCTRARLSAEGQLYTCLFAVRGHDLRALVRSAADDAELEAAIATVWTRRTDRYSELRTEKTAELPKIEMSYIGG